MRFAPQPTKKAKARPNSFVRRFATNSGASPRQRPCTLAATDVMDRPDDMPVAGRGVVSDPPGGTTTLTLYAADQTLAELQLGPSEAIALASDLLLSARRRYGRPREEARA